MAALRLPLFAAVLSACFTQLVHAQTQAPGDPLLLAWCDSTDPLQAFSHGSDGTVRTVNGAFCVANVGGTTLALAACDPSSPLQQWIFTQSMIVQGGVTSGLAWNLQSSESYMSAGSSVKLWAASPPNWNDFFFSLPSSVGTGNMMLQANFTSAGNSTPTDLCVASHHTSPVFPTPQQLAWQESEIACFVHFQMATAAGTQGCSGGAPPPISIWAPSALDTDTWAKTCASMGGKRMVYTAKHGCGFLTWNTSVTSYNYTYSVAHSPYPDVDVVQRFVDSARALNLGVGFYYSVVSNAYANVQNGVVGPGPIDPTRQINVTQDQYNDLVIQHLTDLWSRYGALEELWFDGGYAPALAPALTSLFAKLQPNVVAFQAEGLMPSPVRWVGTESGFAPRPCWSTCDYSAYGAGDPDATTWFPAETDFTLQNGDNWFYNPSAGVHPPSQLRAMVEASLGSNTALIIDIAPFPNGTVPPEQVQAASLLGEYMTACYDATPVATGSGNGFNLTITTPNGAAALVDRVVVGEDQSFGQLIRAFTVSATLANGSVVEIASGSSVGNKFIGVLPTALNVVSATVSVQGYIGTPQFKFFSLFACNQLAQEIDDKWDTWVVESGYKAPSKGDLEKLENSGDKYVRTWANNNNNVQRIRAA